MRGEAHRIQRRGVDADARGIFARSWRGVELDDSSLVLVAVRHDEPNVSRLEIVVPERAELVLAAHQREHARVRQNAPLGYAPCALEVEVVAGRAAEYGHSVERAMDGGDEDLLAPRQAVDEGERKGFAGFKALGRRGGFVAPEALDALCDIRELDARQVFDGERRHVEAVGRQRNADDRSLCVAVGPDLAGRRAGDVRRLGELSRERGRKRVRIGRRRREHQKQPRRRVGAMLRMERDRLFGVDVRPDTASCAAGICSRNRSRQSRALVVSPPFFLKY